MTAVHRLKRPVAAESARLFGRDGSCSCQPPCGEPAFREFMHVAHTAVILATADGSRAAVEPPAAAAARLSKRRNVCLRRGFSSDVSLQQEQTSALLLHCHVTHDRAQV
jgi:hypothetical protein